MLKKIAATTTLFAMLLLAPLSGSVPLALADDAQGNGAPVLMIHSTGGTIHLYSVGGGGVHVQPGAAGQRIGITRFTPGQFAQGPMLPAQQVCRGFGRRVRCFRLPARQFSVPPALYNSQGFHVENPGGDMSIGVPQHVGAVFINAEQGNVEVEKLRGPFIIQASNGDVHLKNVFGRGLIRTTSGNITLQGVGGDVHLVTGGGAITVFGSSATKADVQSQSGPITWRFAKVGNGPYKFASEQGAIHLQFLPGVAAQVDAQSDNGNVYNMLPGVNPVAAQQHALSVPINGGGPEITVTSTSGDITIEQLSTP
jgi:Putative adhesin